MQSGVETVLGGGEIKGNGVAPCREQGRIDVVPSIGTGSVSLKHIARRAAHAAEREVMLLVLERTEWNRVRAAKLLEISYRALLG